MWRPAAAQNNVVLIRMWCLKVTPPPQKKFTDSNQRGPWCGVFLLDNIWCSCRHAAAESGSNVWLALRVWAGPDNGLTHTPRAVAPLPPTALAPLSGIHNRVASIICPKCCFFLLVHMSNFTECISLYITAGLSIGLHKNNLSLQKASRTVCT